MPALQRFFHDERIRRGWSVREASRRSRISQSKGYAIEAGDDNVEFETFENIASAFGMMPAELAVAIGKGRPEDDPDEARLLASFRLLPQERRPIAVDVVHGMAGAAQPLRPAAKRRVAPDAMRPSEHARDLTGSHEPGTDDGNNIPVRVAQRWVKGTAGHISHLLVNGLSWPLKPAAGIVATT